MELFGCKTVFSSDCEWLNKSYIRNALYIKGTLFPSLKNIMQECLPKQSYQNWLYIVFYVSLVILRKSNSLYFFISQNLPCGLIFCAKLTVANKVVCFWFIIIDDLIIVIRHLQNCLYIVIIQLSFFSPKL